MAEFTRGIRNPHLMDALSALAAGPSWWADVLKDKSLLIGIRDEYLNVYWCGQSLFKIGISKGRLTVSTHPKYLLDPDTAGQTRLDPDTGAFGSEGFDPLVRQFRPGETLGKLKRAAAVYAGEEKKGVQAIANANADVLDVEIAFPSDPGQRSAPRIDFVHVEEAGSSLRLAFWEAKLFDNTELRAKGEAVPSVVEQLAAYEGLLSAQADAIAASYRIVAGNQMRLAEMSGGARSVGPAIARLAESDRSAVEVDPKVRLVVYGFDADQRGGAWSGMIEKLERCLGGATRIRAIGNPKGLRL